ncbi:VOC family protein [Actinomadura sp. 6N118]|uniref:VOC family protein n=1 Tax=Actinomadura sp. 6N118 TaxID=3375151 RepID=UPI0037AE87A7
MINGVHVIVYSRDADADRAFIRDVLGFPGVDVGGGWLIFKLPPAEIAAHPTEGEPQHELYLMCDDLEKTLGDLRSKGVEIAKPPSDQGWGTLAAIKLPSGAELSLYEPHHQVAYDL